jgi:NitT/TauT family transport system ATP-binding protein
VAEAVFLSTRILVLSSNPGRIAEVIEVPLAFPRTAETRETREYLELVIEVTRALHRVAVPGIARSAT